MPCCGPKKPKNGESAHFGPPLTNEEMGGHFAVDTNTVGGTQGQQIATQVPGDQTGARTSLQGKFDWDELHEKLDCEDYIRKRRNYGSIIGLYIGKIHNGMDLSKVKVPVYLLEPRSLLEMYADFFNHAGLFETIADERTEERRFIAVVRWYLSGFHTARKYDVAKKPYNPLLGEIFKCGWKTGSDSKQVFTDTSEGVGNTDGNKSLHTRPSTKSRKSSKSISVKSLPATATPLRNEENLSVIFTAEQVSTQPPLSVFVVKCRDKDLILRAEVSPKPKLQLFSASVENEGEAVISWGRKSRKTEDYIMGYPNAYVRGILLDPWIELGGKVQIRCPQTGYFAELIFQTCSMFVSSEKNVVTAKLFGPLDKTEPFLTLCGIWNGNMKAEWSTSRVGLETDNYSIEVMKLPIQRKCTMRLVEQEIFESRRLWKEVTRAIQYREGGRAEVAKFFLEQKQRKDFEARETLGEIWIPRLFKKGSSGKWDLIPEPT